MQLTQNQIESVLAPAQMVQELFHRNEQRANEGDSLLQATNTHLKRTIEKLPDNQQLELEALYWFGKGIGLQEVNSFCQALEIARAEREKWQSPKSQGSFLANVIDLATSLKRGLQKQRQEELRSEAHDTHYADSKIKEAFRHFVVRDEKLSERVKNERDGLSFLRLDTTGRFSAEAAVVNGVLGKVKQVDFSQVSENEFRSLAEALFSAYKKLDAAESAIEQAVTK